MLWVALVVILSMADIHVLLGEVATSLALILL